MSEKFKGSWRKVKEVVGICVIVIIPVVFVGGLIGIAMILLCATVAGAIIRVCWNTAMTTMFGFKELTLIQAAILFVAIDCLRTNYLSKAKTEYAEAKKEIFGECQKKKIVKIGSVICVAISELILIFIAIWSVMYSWNNILPQVLNVELVQINWTQALGFACLLNFILSQAKSKGNESKKKKENKVKLEVEDVPENDNFTE